MTDNDDILERLKHPEREPERRQPDGTLFVRNILNSVFMLMAAVAMIGLVVTWSNDTPPTWCYLLGLLAVIVKMVEAMLRMPGLLKRPQRPQPRRFNAAEAAAPQKPDADADEAAKAGDKAGADAATR